MRLTWNATLGTAFVIALVLGVAGVASAQNPPAQQPPAQQQAENKPALTFEGDLALMLVYVKPDKTADFEAIMAKAKEALVKLDTVETRQEASTMKWYKWTVNKPDTPFVMYCIKAEPPVTGAEYAPLMLIYKAFPTEYAGFRDKWKEMLHPNQMQGFAFVQVGK